MQSSVLAFDTSGASASVALAGIEHETDTVTCIRQVELAAKSSAARLLPTIVAMLQQAGLTLASLHALVVVHGPGSFTGVRVGVSTAKGLAHASGVPVLAISRLAVLASLSPAPECRALLDAGRGELYAGHYRGAQCEREWLTSVDETAEAAASGMSLVVAEESIAARLSTWHPLLAGPLDACAAVRAARERLLARDWDDLAALDANYLRRSDAELFARIPAQKT